MNRDRAVTSLAALAQATRLEAFRQLVQSGAAGLSAGDLAERLGISPPALSFHLRGLAQAGLVRSRQRGGGLDGALQRAGINRLQGHTRQCHGKVRCLLTPTLVEMDAGQAASHLPGFDIFIFAVTDEQK